MAVLKDARTDAPGFGNQVEYVRYTYDFAVDGGAATFYDILTASQRMVIVSAHATVKTTCTSGGSATVIWGVTGNTNRFMNTTQGAVASLTAGSTIVPVAVEGTPNVLPTPCVLPSGDKVLMTIGTAALTAGKIEFVIGLMKQ